MAQFLLLPPLLFYILFPTLIAILFIYLFEDDVMALLLFVVRETFFSLLFHTHSNITDIRFKANEHKLNLKMMMMTTLKERGMKRRNVARYLLRYEKNGKKKLL